jgi:protein O-GlcNAc transferase
MTATLTAAPVTPSTPQAPVDSWTVSLASGLRLQVPPSLRCLTTYVLLEQETWFEPEMSLMPLLLEPGMHALDIGANHGIYALEIARCTGSGHVWAFEPTSEPLQRLRASVEANGLGERITVVGAGLADTDGEASFALQDNSELNSRGGTGSRRETVQLLALDGYLAAHAPGQVIDFVKLDAEGEEINVLAGAQRFFAHQSPVVMFEFKHGASQNTPLLAAWQALGYDLFRWSAELRLLLPFDSATSELDFALNLLAIRPTQQQHLVGRGLLVTSEALATTPTPEAGATGLLWLCQQQALQGVALDSVLHDDAYGRALRAVAAAHGAPGLMPAQRAALMIEARQGLFQACAAGAAMAAEAWALLVHVLLALGAQSAAVQMAGTLLGRWPTGAAPDLLVMPPRSADLQRRRSTPLDAWLRQMLGEFVQTHCAYSSYFMPPVPQRFAALLQHPDHSAEVERRFLLMHVTAGTAAPVADLVRLAEPSQTHNPTLWQGLMQAMAVGNHPAKESAA